MKALLTSNTWLSPVFAGGAESQQSGAEAAYNGDAFLALDKNSHWR